MKLLLAFLSVIIVIASVVLCSDYIVNSISNQNNKKFDAELNSVKYGLFSVDEWKYKLVIILKEEINKLDLSENNEQDIRKHVETLLNSLIDEGDRKIKAGNSHSKMGFIKQKVINFFINKKNIKKGIPEYTKIIINEMTKVETKNQVKTILIQKLDMYNDNTFDTADSSQIKSLLLRTNSKDLQTARTILNKIISSKSDLVFKESWLLIILSVILFIIIGSNWGPISPSQYVLLILSLVILLIAGVTTPMIDMEAKISQITFTLMGHTIHFENQVLYFQSKSILDVFWIMITHHSLQMKFIGVLLIAFSIFFPLLKIISSFIFYFNFKNAKNNALIKYFVLKSGKWSMTDVMVVAIFMAYIGFNGIITSQFGQLNTTGQKMVFIATNGTSLQPGYYIFVTYCLLSLLLSEFITRKHMLPNKSNPIIVV